jgi:L-iditol 2-dehydrogenase
MSAKMQAAILYGKQDVRLEEIERPRAGAGEVVIRIETALTCGTDLKVFKRGYHAKMIRPPSVFGHELSGIIHEVGAGVRNFSEGDRVVAANSAPCGACYFCQRQQENLCEDIVWLNGAYAQFIKVPARIVEKNLLKIPAALSFRAAALTEPLACTVRGANDIGIGPDSAAKAPESVLIIGGGPLGLMFLAVAKHFANARVITVAKNATRQKIARRLGADAVVDGAQKDWIEWARSLTDARRGADVVIEAVGKPETWEAAVSLTRKGGRVNLFGGCPTGTYARFDTNAIHYGDVQMRSSFHHTPRDIRRALEILAARIVKPEDFVSDERSLSELPQLLASMAEGTSAVKTAVLPPR